MDPQPSILRILQNDSWAAPPIGAFITSASITAIILLTNHFVEDVQIVNISTFFWMTGISFCASVVIAILRIRFVRQLFAHGIIVQAQVLESSHFRSNLRLKLRYTYLAHTYEKKVEQVITGKTKTLMQQKEVTIVVDQRNPDHILLQIGYL